MLTAAVWLMLNSMLYDLRLDNAGSFPKPLSTAEERRYLALARQGDLAARNVLIEPNLRLIANIMKKKCTLWYYPDPNIDCAVVFAGHPTRAATPRCFHTFLRISFQITIAITIFRSSADFQYLGNQDFPV